MEECSSFLFDESHLGRMKIPHMLKYIGDATEPIREVITSAMAEECSVEIPSLLYGWTCDLPSHAQITDATPLLDIQSQRHEEEEQENMRHRFPLTVLLEVDPQNYQPADKH
ncbi:hypothetical protein Tco_0532223 [Tanacetum coccineum]